MEREQTKSVSIYALAGPDGAVRYIGQTRALLEERLLRHINESRRPRVPCSEWIASLRAAGTLPRIHLVATVSAAEANEAERHQISTHLEQGAALLNVQHTPRSRVPHGAPRRHRTQIEPPAEESRIMLRLPVDLWEAISDAAREDARSLNSEIIVAVQWYARRRGLPDAIVPEWD